MSPYDDGSYHDQYSFYDDPMPPGMDPAGMAAPPEPPPLDPDSPALHDCLHWLQQAASVLGDVVGGQHYAHKPPIGPNGFSPDWTNWTDEDAARASKEADEERWAAAGPIQGDPSKPTVGWGDGYQGRADRYADDNGGSYHTVTRPDGKVVKMFIPQRPGTPEEQRVPPGHIVRGDGRVVRVSVPDDDPEQYGFDEGGEMGPSTGEHMDQWGTHHAPYADSPNLRRGGRVDVTGSALGQPHFNVTSRPGTYIPDSGKVVSQPRRTGTLSDAGGRALLDAVARQGGFYGPMPHFSYPETGHVQHGTGIKIPQEGPFRIEGQGRFQTQPGNARVVGTPRHAGTGVMRAGQGGVDTHFSQYDGWEMDDAYSDGPGNTDLDYDPFQDPARLRLMEERQRWQDSMTEIQDRWGGGSPEEYGAVDDARAALGRSPGMGNAGPGQVEQWAQNQWFNQTSAQEEYPHRGGYKDFGTAVKRAVHQLPGDELNGQYALKRSGQQEKDRQLDEFRRQQQHRADNPVDHTHTVHDPFGRHPRIPDTDHDAPGSPDRDKGYARYADDDDYDDDYDDWADYPPDSEDVTDYCNYGCGGMLEQLAAIGQALQYTDYDFDHAPGSPDRDSGVTGYADDDSAPHGPDCETCCWWIRAARAAPNERAPTAKGVGRTCEGETTSGR